MLAHYTGMRREEFCALSVDDVVTTNGENPYLHVCFNAFGRVKNAQSVRNLALHPELVRLGFLDYVAALHRLGHKRFFPDLFSPSTRSLLGDRLYDELRRAFTRAGFTTHQVRHFFGNALKQQRVAEEFRADLLPFSLGGEHVRVPPGLLYGAPRSARGVATVPMKRSRLCAPSAPNIAAGISRSRADFSGFMVRSLYGGITPRAPVCARAPRPMSYSICRSGNANPRSSGTNSGTHLCATWQIDPAMISCMVP